MIRAWFRWVRDACGSHTFGEYMEEEMVSPHAPGFWRY